MTRKEAERLIRAEVEAQGLPLKWPLINSLAKEWRRVEGDHRKPLTAYVADGYTEARPAIPAPRTRSIVQGAHQPKRWPTRLTYAP